MGALNLTERLPDWKADQAGADYSKDESNLREKIPSAQSRFFCTRIFLQSGASSQAKIGGAYFSGVTGSIQDPIAVPGPCEVTEP